MATVPNSTVGAVSDTPQMCNNESYVPFLMQNYVLSVQIKFCYDTALYM